MVNFSRRRKEPFCKRANCCLQPTFNGFFTDAPRYTKTEMKIPLDDLLPDTKLAFCRTLRYEATKAGSQMVEIHIVLSSEHIEKTISDTVLFVDK